jgi:hypothetical protein
MTQLHANTSLENVNFGRLDAESDRNLLSYFVVTGTVHQVQDGAQLIIGRKGTGKTALFKHLAAKLESQVVELDLNDYVFELHRGFVEAGLSADRAYKASWKLLIYSAMFATLRDEMPNKLRSRGDEVLQNLGIGGNRNIVQGMFRWLKRVRKIDLPSIEGLASAGGLELADEETAPLSTDTIHAIETLEEIVQEEATRRPITVLIDRLDDAWDGTKDSLNLIAGAVRATRDMARDFGHPQPAPVITFLRSDLWEKVEFNDQNKTSQDRIDLDWDNEGLTKIVDRRIHESVGTELGSGWDYVFSTDEMRQRASAKTYILKRAMGRPRDVIAFSIFARQEALRNEHDRIEAQDIYEAEKRYSKHILDELKDEISRHVNDFTVVINTLKSLRQRTFVTSAWTNAATQNGMSVSEASTALDLLMESSAVGVHGVGGASGGSKTIYRYQDRHLQRRDDAVLQVHLALVRELSLKDS